MIGEDGYDKMEELSPSQMKKMLRHPKLGRARSNTINGVFLPVKDKMWNPCKFVDGGTWSI